ncbi:MAG: hypothetical protein LBN95_13495, partial [Prevotellaceae bacterium]|nr:hypothetical protein [Prevotellaceae bacterium]
VDNFNEIREDKGDKLLAVRRTNVSNIAVLKIDFDSEKDRYKIKTVMPIRNAQLFRKKLLCANDH